MSKVTIEIKDSDSRVLRNAARILAYHPYGEGAEACSRLADDLERVALQTRERSDRIPS